MRSYLFDRYRYGISTHRHGALMASGVMVMANGENEAMRKAKKLNKANAGVYEERLKLRSIRSSHRQHTDDWRNSLTHRSEWK